MKYFVQSILLVVTLFITSQIVFSSSVYSLYDCPSMMEYSPYIINPAKSCKYAKTFGMTTQECEAAIKKQYEPTNKELRAGQCKDKGHKILEGQYNTTSCSINFMTYPSPKIYGHGYANDKGFGYNGGDDIDGAKCLDILYKELKSKYPNIQK